MSKTKAAAKDAGPVEVRALMDDATHGLKAGALATVPADMLDALKDSGLVDDHADAVAYAKEHA